MPGQRDHFRRKMRKNGFTKKNALALSGTFSLGDVGEKGYFSGCGIQREGKSGADVVFL